jgi:hypothetical protein
MIENDRKDANALRKAAKGGRKRRPEENKGGRLKTERTGVIEN